VKSAGGERQTIPRNLLLAALQHASRLGRKVLTDDLLLLAIAELPDGSPARRALEAESVDFSRIRSVISERQSGASEIEGATKGGRIHLPPAYNGIEGRAQAFAAALGEDGTITPEFVLLALLWDPMSQSSQALWKLGTGREGIVQNLRKSGVPTPLTPIPAQREIEWGERVWIDREDIPKVLTYVSRHVNPEFVWGFNYEGEQAWVNAEASVDLEAIVRKALGS
jgi:hypothetical protein